VVLASISSGMQAICSADVAVTILEHMRTARVRIILPGALTVLLASCVSGPPVSSPTVSGPPVSGPPGAAVDGLVDVGGGRSIYVRCAGEGSPIVVLIAGKGNGAQDWQDVLAPGDPAADSPGDDLPWGMGVLEPSEAAVLPSTARFTRVCAYDRPDVRVDGPDVSTPRPQPHTVDQDVADLHALLAGLADPAPTVLVAHSYGGLIATLFARTYPQSVGGLVMVDAASPLVADVTDGRRLVNWDAANATTSPQSREGVKLVDAFEQIDAAGPLSPMPAVVLSADKPWRTDLMPADVAAIPTVTFAQWTAAQDLLAGQLGARHIAATASGHDIYLYQPALVTDQIRRIVDDVRSTTS
jgi:pimeloyl-ACP methyl ester carboxylesterase